MGLGLIGATPGFIEYALDGLSLRHAAIASNIANALSPNHRAASVSFEDQLAAAMDAGTQPSHLPAPAVSHALAPGAASPATTETQIVSLNQNVLQYQALLKGLEKYMAPIHLALSDGRK